MTHCICFQDEHKRHCPAIRTGNCLFQSLYNEKGTTDLKSLGSGKTEYISRYDKNLLERFPNPQIHTPYKIDITAPEVTSLCPITKQPDFATFVITYSPNKWCVESKSLKLYLFSYRQEGIFHEAMTNRVAEDLFDVLDPHWIEVVGQFTPRGGIKFWPTVRLENGDNHHE